MVGRAAHAGALIVRAFALAALLVAAALPARAGLRFCDREPRLAAVDQDRLLRLGALVRERLQRQGAAAALLSRSGLDLSRFGQRYSHAGVALRDAGDSPWAVRQLFYACGEGRPRLYEQGLGAFVLGTDDPAVGYVSAVLLPPEAAAPLAAAALDDRRALSLLGASYSANAYAFSTRYQNCNQWLAELLALAWGAGDATPPREAAQAWLKSAGYRPVRVQVESRLTMLAAGFVSWVHVDDHPEDEVLRMAFAISLPASLEAFVHARWPRAERIEFCHAGRRVVVHRGWTPVADGCVAGDGDETLDLD